MAKAFACDRCSRYEDDEPVAGVTITTPTPAAQVSGSSQRKQREWEMCSQCLALLQDFLSVRTTDPKPEFGKKAAGQ